MHSIQLTHVFVENDFAECIFFTVAVSLLLFVFFFPAVFIQAYQLLLQQQQQQPQQQLLQNQRKFTPNVRQQADPQQVHTNITRSFVVSLPPSPSR